MLLMSGLLAMMLHLNGFASSEITSIINYKTFKE